MLEFESYYGHTIRGLLDQNNLPTQRNQSSVTLTPKLIAPVVMGGSFAGVLLFDFDLIFGLTFIVGLAIFIARALVSKSLAATQLTNNEDSTSKSLKDLEQKIFQAKFLTKNSSLGEVAHAQAKELTEHYAKIMKAVNEKFNPNELAYARYETALKETTHSVMDNLKLINTTLEAMEISSDVDPAQAELVKYLSDNNKQSLKILGDLLHSLNQINAGGSLNASLENSLDELKRLTEQTKKYTR